MSPTEQPENAPSATESDLGAGEPTASVDAPSTGEPSAQGAAEPNLNASAPPAKAKTKGVADIVFMIDVSGSMSPCIDALRTNIEAFINSLSRGEANNAPPIRDWRGKVVGYRDVEAAQSEGLEWIIDAPFVRDVGELKAQLGDLKAEGGGDEPEISAGRAFQNCLHGSKP